MNNNDDEAVIELSSGPGVDVDDEEDDIVVEHLPISVENDPAAADSLWESTESPLASPPRPPADDGAREIRHARERSKAQMRRLWMAVFELQDTLVSLGQRRRLLRKRRRTHLRALRMMLEYGRQFVSTSDALAAAEQAEAVEVLNTGAESD